MMAFFCEFQGHSSAIDHSQIIAYCANQIVEEMVGLLLAKKDRFGEKIAIATGGVCAS